MNVKESFTAHFFKKMGYAYFPKLIPIQKCEEFADLMLSLKNEKNLKYDGENPNPYYKESHSGNHPEFEKVLREVTPRVADELQVKIKPANSYCRIYYNGATLTPHKDRSGLDYVMSVTLRSTLQKEWPLYCIDHLGTTVPLHINQGDGGILLGNTMTHWRDNLVCSPDDYVVQLFLHWSFDE